MQSAVIKLLYMPACLKPFALECLPLSVLACLPACPNLPAFASYYLFLPICPCLPALASQPLPAYCLPSYPCPYYYPYLTLFLALPPSPLPLPLLLPLLKPFPTPASAPNRTYTATLAPAHNPTTTGFYCCPYCPLDCSWPALLAGLSVQSCYENAHLQVRSGVAHLVTSLSA